TYISASSATNSCLVWGRGSAPSKPSAARPRPTTGTTSQIAEKLDLALILGGAAVHRCDKRLVFSDGFLAAGGRLRRAPRVFQQSVQPPR
ncbi:MAG: hypothetical protein ABR988_17795, partial [Terriglobales bacterium]